MNTPDQADVVLIAGARPNFVKIAPLSRAIADQGRLSALLLHTGQHHDFEMSHAFFEDLEIPTPDVYLGAQSGSHAEQTGHIMMGFEEFLGRCRARMIVVVGDVNSTLACSIVAAKAGVPIAHVEAGLRSFDRAMPEEINRVVTDALADVLYTTCEDGTQNLLREGVPADRVHEVGNVMIDTLLRYRPQAAELPLPLPDNFRDGGFALATIHRPSNVDQPAALARVLTILKETAELIPVVFPVHPRTRKHMAAWGMDVGLEAARVYPMPPQSYLRFLRLLLGAAVVLTDSGGIQEETTVLGIPCLTLRENTERPVTATIGTNRIVGLDRVRIHNSVREILAEHWATGTTPAGWDGRAAERIATHLADTLS